MGGKGGRKKKKMEKSLHVYWSIKITYPEGIALSMLCLIHHSRVPSKVPKPYPGLTIILGKTPDCPSRSKKGESIGTLAWSWRTSFDVGHSHISPAGPTGITSSRKTHAEYKEATSQWDEIQGSLGEMLQREEHTPTRKAFVLCSILFLLSLCLPLPKYCWVLSVSVHSHILPSCRHINSQENPTACFPLLTLSPHNNFLWLPGQICWVDSAHALQLMSEQKALVLVGNASPHQQFALSSLGWDRTRLCSPLSHFA